MNKILRLSSVFLTVALLVAMVAGTVYVPDASALSGSSFKAGNIIDDTVFFNSNTLSAGDIQNFLNAKVPTCDTWGTQAHGDTTRAAYGASVGNPAPYTCLKDYRQDTPGKAAEAGLCAGIPAANRSSAEIVYTVSQYCGVDARVLLVLLQKEQSLVTDDWPWPVQYRSATGYGCPDSAPCDSDYYGFFNQVYSAARQFKRYSRDRSSYNYRAGYTNYIQYNPVAACGGSTVYIENQATAGLYDYTPYQPNAAALSDLYGSGDSCSAFGNRNFWRMFNDWFGPTTGYEYFTRVIEAPDDSRYFLQVGNTKRWIPTADIYNDWGLSTYSVIQVNSIEFANIPTIPELGRVGLLKNGQYVFVDAGQKYILDSADVVANYGLSSAAGIASPMYGLLAAMPTAGDANQFVQEAGGSTTYLMTGGVLHPIDPTYIARYGSIQPSVLSTNALTLFPTSTTIGYKFSSANKNYFMDRGKLLDVSSSSSQAAYGSVANGFTAIDPAALPFFAKTTASIVVNASDSGSWQLLINGRQQYVPNIYTLRAWGIGITQPQVISPELLSEFSTGSTLGVTVHGTTSGNNYFLDGMKHLITPSLQNAWIGSGATMSMLDAEIIPDTGSQYTSSLMRITGTTNVYMAVNGSYYYVPSGGILNGLGYPAKYDVMNVSANGPQGMTFAGNIGQFLVNGGVTYYMQDGTAYPLASSTASAWTSAGPAPTTYTGTDFAQRFTISGVQLGKMVIDSTGSKWLIDNGSLINANMYGDAYGSMPQIDKAITDLPRQSAQATYLAKSTNTADTRVWLINKGSKQWIINGATYNGYGSGLPLTRVSDVFLQSIPTTGDPSITIKAGTSGFKFIVNGQFYSFADGDTVVNILGPNGPTDVSQSIFNTIYNNVGAITRLVRDTSTGKVYYMENGAKRWISNGQAYSRYAAIPVTSLPSDVINWFPNGVSID